MSIEIPQVTLTTDGAARGNPGPGGWAALLEADGREKLLTGEVPERTTNNAMELLAVVAGLEALRKPAHVTLRADSQYVLDGIARLQAGGAPAQKNRALWERLQAQLARHTVTLAWVKGHAGDARNERMDRESNAAATRAYARAEAATPSAPADAWTLTILSPAADRPVQWALDAANKRHSGEVTVDTGTTQPTAVWAALINALTLAATFPAAHAATLHVQSNYELIIKQGRGEWGVKQAAQQPYARKLAELRPRFAALRFSHVPTAEARGLLDKVTG